MKKIIIAVVSIVGALALATPALAGVPSNIKQNTILVSKAGQGGVWNITKNGKTLKARIKGCKVDPKMKTYQEFTFQGEHVAVEKKLFDDIMKYNKHNWDTTMGELSEENYVCEVIYMK